MAWASDSSIPKRGLGFKLSERLITQPQLRRLTPPVGGRWKNAASLKA
jgi:hypothetical protein